MIVKTFFIAALLIALTLVASWQTIAWYWYPCEAFKVGHLRNGYAPARCLQ